MNENREYKFSIMPQNSKFASIELSAQVLGGNEALAFSAMLGELSKTNVSCLLVNLEQVELMNSSGLGMLVNAHSTLSKYEKKLVLCSVPEKVESLLKMTHLNEVFTIFPTVDEALDNCN